MTPSIQRTIEALRGLGYRPSEPERTRQGDYRVTMPARSKPGRLTLYLEPDGTYHRPVVREQSHG